MFHGAPAGARMRVESQGAKDVGDETVQITATESTSRCYGIWVNAPDGDQHTADANTQSVLIGVGTTDALNQVGAAVLRTNDYVGFMFPCKDPTTIYATSSAAGQSVEFKVLVAD